MYLEMEYFYLYPDFRNRNRKYLFSPVYPTMISDYLIRIRVSEPISIALNIRERKSVEKNNLAHT